MSVYIPIDLRHRIQAVDQNRCCYCQTSELLSGIRMTFDHILPRSKSGNTSFENVCLACRSCNEFKGNATTALDPLTQQIVRLFHPRTQIWSQHFLWSDDGTRVEGKTSTGRVTVLTLQMNNSAIVTARKRWVSVGWHPPINF